MKDESERQWTDQLGSILRSTEKEELLKLWRKLYVWPEDGK